MIKQQYTVLAGALMGALVIIPIALYFVLADAEGALAMPEPLLLAAFPVAGVLVHLLVGLVGYRTAAIAPGTPEQEALRTAQLQFASAMIRRFALCESIAIISIALCFVVPTGGYTLVLVGCATALVLMAFHVWPGPRTVTRTAESLDRDGGRSGLREAFGLAPGGAVQEL